MENGPFIGIFPLKWWCSIVMLVYQRVILVPSFIAGFVWSNKKLLFGRGAMVQQQRRPATCAQNRLFPWAFSRSLAYAIYNIIYIYIISTYAKSVAPSKSIRCMAYVSIFFNSIWRLWATAQGRGLRLGSQPPGRWMVIGWKNGETPWIANVWCGRSSADQHLKRRLSVAQHDFEFWLPHPTFGTCHNRKELWVSESSQPFLQIRWGRQFLGRTIKIYKGRAILDRAQPPCLRADETGMVIICS